jgi:phosphoglycolate phosphatase
MRRPSVLLWDWDNTLVDAWASIAAALNAAFDAFGLPKWTLNETRERVRVSLRDSFPQMFGAEWRRAASIFYATLGAQHLRHVRPMPGALAALEAGSAWPQGVVSNKTGRYLRAEVDHLGWTPRFGAVIGAGDAAADKPSPAPILLALSQIGAVADHTVWYLGDTASDMQAARAAGITAVLVGDAVHDGGIDKAAPDLQFGDAYGFAAHLRSFGVGEPD